MYMYLEVFNFSDKINMFCLLSCVMNRIQYVLIYILYPEFRALLALQLCQRLTFLQEYYA
jgi:hypothetical protein